jgi:ATP-dependent protease HslVU (ClpYQ) peptidase subunit
MEFGGKVLLAGDIQGTGGNNKIIHTQAKVFRRNGIVIGYTTSYRFGQLLEHVLPDPVPPKRDEEIYRWLVAILIPNIRKVMKEELGLQADDDGSGYKIPGGEALIGVHGQLWYLQDDFSVLRSVEGFSAVGSGYEYALGSIFTFLSLHGKKKLTLRDAENALRLAVTTAGTYSPSVGTSSVIVTT